MNASITSIENNQIPTTTAVPKIAVRLYENQKFGKSFGPAKFHNAIYNATADVVVPSQKYLLDFLQFDGWTKTARSHDQLNTRDEAVLSIKQQGMDLEQVLASWIKRYDHTGQKMMVEGFSTIDLVTNQLEIVILDQAIGIEEAWRLEVRPCRIKYGQKSPQLLATNYDLN